MMLGTIRPIALSHLSQAFRSLVIARRCHSALYGCWLHNFLPEVSPRSLARVQVLGRHSGCRAWGALRARGSPLSHSILSEFGSALMVQGLGTAGQPTTAQLAAINDVGYEVIINLATGTTPRDLPNEAAV